MNTRTIIAIAIAAVGVVLLMIGFNASDAPVDQITKTFTGNYTDATMRYFIVGTAAVVGGGLLAVFGKRSS
jgi:hypothetical protein